MAVKPTSTLILKTIVILFALAVLALCLIILPSGIKSDNTGMYRPIFLGMYIPAIPFFIGIFQVLKLLSLIDKNNVFSQSSVKALQIIKYCGLCISGLYALGLPFIFMAAERDDAPGVVLIGLIFTFAPLIIAVAAALFQKLMQNAIDIKLENEQTV